MQDSWHCNRGWGGEAQLQMGTSCFIWNTKHRLTGVSKSHPSLSQADGPLNRLLTLPGSFFFPTYSVSWPLISCVGTHSPHLLAGSFNRLKRQERASLSAVWIGTQLPKEDPGGVWNSVSGLGSWRGAGVETRKHPSEGWCNIQTGFWSICYGICS